SGGVISIGVRLAVIEPRIAAAGLFAGSFVPRTIFEEARQVTVPLHVLLQWDDEGNDRQAALDLFDAFGSKEKTLNANMGGHTGRRTARPTAAGSARSPPGTKRPGVSRGRGAGAPSDERRPVRRRCPRS